MRGRICRFLNDISDELNWMFWVDFDFIKEIEMKWNKIFKR